MEGSSNLSNYSNTHMPSPIIRAEKPKKVSGFLEAHPTARPFKYADLSEKQLLACQEFSCGNTGIDTFLRHGDGLRFKTDRHKMDAMVVATETKILGYMAYSVKEATFYVPQFCSTELYHEVGLEPSDEILVIHYVGVDQKICYRKGLGKWMISKAFDFGLQKAKTNPNLKLMVLHATPEACDFYESLGFHRIRNVNDGLIEYAYTLCE